MAKITSDLRPIETALLLARRIAEELGDVVVVYFIDMAIAETRRENPHLPEGNKTSYRRAIESLSKEKR